MPSPNRVKTFSWVLESSNSFTHLFGHVDDLVRADVPQHNLVPQSWIALVFQVQEEGSHLYDRRRRPVSDALPASKVEDPLAL